MSIKKGKPKKRNIKQIINKKELKVGLEILLCHDEKDKRRVKILGKSYKEAGWWKVKVENELSQSETIFLAHYGLQAFTRQKLWRKYYRHDWWIEIIDIC